MKKSAVLFLGLAIFISCGNKKKIVEQEEVQEVKVMQENKGRAPSKITARIGDVSKEMKSDAFSILDIHIDGNLLHLTVEYSGGCGEHSFEVIGSEMIMKSLPAQRPVVIVHSNGGDYCKALITEEMTVDISEFAYKKEAGNEIVLIFKDRDKIVYKFED
jgi:hypothetical protein